MSVDGSAASQMTKRSWSIRVKGWSPWGAVFFAKTKTPTLAIRFFLASSTSRCASTRLTFLLLLASKTMRSPAAADRPDPVERPAPLSAVDGDAGRRGVRGGGQGDQCAGHGQREAREQREDAAQARRAGDAASSHLMILFSARWLVSQWRGARSRGRVTTVRSVEMLVVFQNGRWCHLRGM